jgi:hypothetical protein
MPATDTFSRFQATANAPASHAAVITPSNTTDLATATRGLYVGVSGDVKVDMLGGEAGVTFIALAAAVIHPIRVTRVYATGTTASSILGLY